MGELARPSAFIGWGVIIALSAVMFWATLTPPKRRK
jgi:hypothetical protein